MTREPRARGRHRRRRPAVRRVGAGGGDSNSQSEAGRRRARGHLGEDDVPSGPASRFLRDPQVRARSDQATGGRHAVVSTCAGVRVGEELRGRELACGPASRQVPVSPAALPATPAVGSRRDPAGPIDTDRAGASIGGAAGADLRCAGCVGADESGARDGRNPDQGRADEPGKDEGRLFLARVRRQTGSRVSVLGVPSRGDGA